MKREATLSFFPINWRVFCVDTTSPAHRFCWHMCMRISADPASPWPRQGGAWDHRRCGTLLSLKATVNGTIASDLKHGPLHLKTRLTARHDRSSIVLEMPSPFVSRTWWKGRHQLHRQLELAFAMLRLARWRFYQVSKLTDGLRSRSQRRPQAQNVFGAGFSHAAAGAWLVLSGFKTDGWPPAPIPKASPGPKCRWSWL